MAGRRNSGAVEGDVAQRRANQSASVKAPDDAYIISLALYTSLKELRKPVELVIYPQEFHVKNQPKHRFYTYQRNLDWFRFWLKDEEDPDPAKAEQYKRWRAVAEVAAEERNHTSRFQTIIIVQYECNVLINHIPPD